VYYHANVDIAGKNYLTFSNQSEEYILKNVVVPFINGQVIESDHTYGKKKSILINMKSSTTLSIYRTEEKVDASKFIPQSSSFSIPEEFDQFDCTSDFVKRVREIQSAPAMRSLLQMAFRPPEQQVFVIMKFGNKQLDSAYEGVIKPLSQEFGLNVVRVDEIQDSGRITDQILENISKSRLVLSDLSGERPNCYYETGFAHALGKDIVLTIHKESAIHFDLSSHRFIQWETENELRIALNARFTAILGNKK